MYGLVVSNTGANGQAYIISGKPTPVLGMNGMCAEFDSIDSGGSRSDALYCYEGWMNSLATRASMMMMGAWGGPYQSVNESYMYAGTFDLIFKLHEGYHGVYLGTTRNVYDTGLPAGKGYFYNKDIWDNYVNSVSPPSPGPDVTVQIGPLQITVYVSNDWHTGYTAHVTLVNTSSAIVNQWALSFDIPSTITSIWSASITSHTGQNYKFAPLSW